MHTRFLAILLLSAFFALDDVRAAVIEVDEALPGGCTLHDAIRAANADAPRGDCTAGNGGDTIRIASPQSISLESALPTINTVMVIKPDDIGRRAVRRNSGSGFFRVFDVRNGHLVLERIDVEGGELRGAADGGGAGIRVRDGALGLVDVVIQDNSLIDTNTGGSAILSRNSIVEIVGSSIQQNWSNMRSGSLGTHGSGINAFDSVISIRDSLLSVNRAVGNQVHAAHRFHNSMLTVERSRFDDGAYGHLQFLFENSSDGLFVNSTLAIGSSPIEIQASTVTFANSTVNDPDVSSETGDGVINFINTIYRGDCGAGVTLNTVTSSLFSKDTCTGIVTPPGDLLLNPSADNGGPTETHALHPMSVAVNAASPGDCPNVDQRGEPRTASKCDIGAFELGTDADIQISAVMATSPPYYVGQQVEVDLNIYNAGPNIVHYIGVDFELQNALLVSVDGACPSLPCELFALSPGGDFQTVTLTVEPFLSGSNDFTITAEAFRGVNAIYEETDISNNDSSVTRNLSPAADVQVTKELLDAPPYFVGQSIDYEIVVSNNGPDAATSVVLTDTPIGLDITAISNCSGPASGPCNFASIVAGSSRTLTVTAEITGTEFDNVADVAAEQYDPDPGNNIAERGNRGSTENDADLEVQLTPLSGPPYINSGFLDYEVEVQNAGPDDATNVRVNVDVGTGRYLIFNIVGNCGPSLLPCELGTIPARSSATFIVQGQFVSDGPESISVYAQADQTDIDPDSNQDVDSITIGQAVDVVATMALISDPPYVQHQPLVYEIVVANIGFNSADNVDIDVVSDNLVVESALGVSCFALPCTVLTVGPTETILVTATPQDVGEFDITLTASAEQFDTEPANNIDDTGNGGTAEVSPADILFTGSFEDFDPSLL